MTIVLETPVDKMEDVNPCLSIIDVIVILDIVDQTAKRMLMNAGCTEIHVAIEDNVSTHLDHISKF